MTLPRDGVLTANGLTAEFRFISAHRYNAGESLVETAACNVWVFDTQLTYDPVRDLPPVFDHMSQNHGLTLAADKCRSSAKKHPRCEACDGTGYRSDVWSDDVEAVKCSTCLGSGVEPEPLRDLSPEAAAVVEAHKP